MEEFTSGLKLEWIPATRVAKCQIFHTKQIIFSFWSHGYIFEISDVSQLCLPGAHRQNLDPRTTGSSSTKSIKKMKEFNIEIQKKLNLFCHKQQAQGSWLKIRKRMGWIGSVSCKFIQLWSLWSENMQIFYASRILEICLSAANDVLPVLPCLGKITVQGNKKLIFESII